MEEFKKYFASEYQMNNAAAIDLKFTHSMKNKIDKKSNTPLNEHVIAEALSFMIRR